MACFAHIVIMLAILHSISGEECLKTQGFGLIHPLVTINTVKNNKETCRLLCLSIPNYNSFTFVDSMCVCQFTNDAGENTIKKGAALVKAAFTLSEDCTIQCQTHRKKGATHGAFACLHNTLRCSCYGQRSPSITDKARIKIEQWQQSNGNVQQWNQFSLIEKEAIRERTCRLEMCKEYIGYFQNDRCTCYDADILFKVEFYMHYIAHSNELHGIKTVTALASDVTAPVVIARVKNLKKNSFNCKLFCSARENHQSWSYDAEKETCICGRIHGPQTDLSFSSVAVTEFDRSQDCTIECQLDGSGHFIFGGFLQVPFGRDTVITKCQCISPVDSTPYLKVGKAEAEVDPSQANEGEHKCLMKTCVGQIGVYLEGECRCFTYVDGRHEVAYNMHQSQLQYEHRLTLACAAVVTADINNLKQNGWNCGLFCYGQRGLGPGSYEETFKECVCDYCKSGTRNSKGFKWGLMAAVDFSRTQDCTIQCQTQEFKDYDFGGLDHENMRCICFRATDAAIRQVFDSDDSDEKETAKWTLPKREYHCLMVTCNGHIGVYFVNCECFKFEASCDPGQITAYKPHYIYLQYRNLSDEDDDDDDNDSYEGSVWNKRREGKECENQKLVDKLVENQKLKDEDHKPSAAVRSEKPPKAIMPKFTRHFFLKLCFPRNRNKESSAQSESKLNQIAIARIVSRAS